MPLRLILAQKFSSCKVCKASGKGRLGLASPFNSTLNTPFICILYLWYFPPLPISKAR